MKSENMMKWILRVALACALLATGACSKSDKDEAAKGDTDQETPATKAQQTPAPRPGDQPTADIPDEDIPVETDFEEAADKEISADNYQQELDKLEKEIGGN